MLNHKLITMICTSSILDRLKVSSGPYLEKLKTHVSQPAWDEYFRLFDFDHDLYWWLNGSRWNQMTLRLSSNP